MAMTSTTLRATLALLLALPLLPAPIFAQVDYQKAQQAGRVWSQKAAQNNGTAAKRATDTRPATAAELDASRERHRDAYDRLANSVGKKNTEKWLAWRAREDRPNR